MPIVLSTSREFGYCLLQRLDGVQAAVVDAQAHPPLGGSRQSQQQPQRGGLARAVGSQQAERAARGQARRQPREGRARTEAPGHAFEDGGHHGARVSQPRCDTGVTVRAGPSEGDRAVDEMTRGSAVVDLGGKGDGWRMILLPNGAAGYILDRQLALKPGQ